METTITDKSCYGEFMRSAETSGKFGNGEGVVRLHSKTEVVGRLWTLIPNRNQVPTTLPTTFLRCYSSNQELISIT